jgi:hypothetical protein
MFPVPLAATAAPSAQVPEEATAALRLDPPAAADPPALVAVVAAVAAVAAEAVVEAGVGRENI